MGDSGAAGGLFALIEPLERLIRRADPAAPPHAGTAAVASGGGAHDAGATAAARWAALAEVASVLATERAGGEDVVEALLDAILRLIEADRAALLAIRAGGDLAPEVVRGPGGRRLDPADADVPRALVRRALDERRPLFDGDPPRTLAIPLEVLPAVRVGGGPPAERRRLGAGPGERRALGAIVASRAGAPLAATTADVDVLAALGHHATAALLHARLYEQATTDSLSRVYARWHFQRVLADAVRRAAESRLPLSLALVDIDDFKRVNDARGHLAGDETIRRMGEVLRGSVRAIDACFRYGGDEFAVLFADTDTGGAAIAAEKIRRAIAEAAFPEAGGRITVSVGHATLPDHAADGEGLVKRADQALYRAKARGKDQAVGFSPEIGAAAKRADRLAGIVTGDFASDYQNVQVLIDAIAAINATNDVSELLTLAVDKVIEATGAERGALMLADGARLATVVARDRGRKNLGSIEKWSRSIPERVLATGESVCLVDAADEGGAAQSRSVAELALRTIMCVPLATKDRTIGVIYVDSRARSGDLKESNLPFFEGLARQVAFAIENARLRARLALGGLGE
jgi:diguanylate cyclase (GGDEF)-like protein